MLVVKLLGQFDIQLNDQPIEIPSRPAQTLFAYLALHPGTAFRREMLAGLIWPEANESNARSNLRHALWRIRKALGEPAGQDYFSADDLTLTFNPDPGCWIDAVLLGGKANAGTAPRTLEEQVAAYQGELLPGFYDDWITIERERLQSAFENKIEALIERLGREKHWPDVIEWAEHWIKFGTAPEPAYRALMTAHAQAGHKAKVKEAYQRCAEALQREFGVVPSDETQALSQQLMVTRPVTQEPSVTPRHNLPAQATPLIGREIELGEITNRLVNDPGCRLLTIVGSGGVGKTRLALHVATQALAQFAAGTFFVSFEAITAIEAIAPAILLALSSTVQDQKDPRLQLLDYLHDKQILLILDNLEHLLAGTELIGEILSAAPAVKIMVTSRERLHLQWEWLYEIQGLDYPRENVEAVESYSAVQLFLQTAQRMRARFSLAEEQPHVTRICQLVEGLPLGLELAASWVRVMPCWEIAQQIEYNLDLLSAQLQDVPDRHRSARAVFEYSWSLLAPEEQQVLLKLSAFPGGFRRGAAEKVTGAPLSLLFTLVDKSLLRVSAAGRYDMHSLLRQYALEKLVQSGQGAAIEIRLLNYYRDYAQEHQHDYAALEDERTNMMACLEIAQRNWQAQLVMDYAEALSEVWSARGHWSDARKGYAWACDAARAHDDDRALMQYLYQWGKACMEQGDYDEAEKLLHQSLDQALHLNEHADRAAVQYELARIAREKSDLATAERLLDESLTLREQLGDDSGVAEVLFLQAGICHDRQEFVQAETLAVRALHLQEQIGDQLHQIQTLNLLADIALHGRSDYTQTEKYCQQAIELCTAQQTTAELASALSTLAEAYRLQGKLPEARQLAERCLALSQSMGSRKPQALYLFRLSKISLDLGALSLALEEGLRSLALCRALESRLAMLYILNHVGQLFHLLSQPDQGNQMWSEALTIAQELKHPLSLMLSQRLH